MIVEKIRIPHVFLSIFMLVVVFIYYEISYSPSIQLLFFSVVLSSLLIAIKGSKRYHIQLVLGGPTLLAGCIMTINGGLALPYIISTIFVGILGMSLSIRSYLNR